MSLSGDNDCQLVHYVLHNRLALSLLHFEASVKPVVGSNRLLSYIRVVTFHARASKDMDNAPLALRFCTSGERRGNKAFLPDGGCLGFMRQNYVIT